MSHVQIVASLLPVTAMHHICKTARYSGRLGSYQQLVWSQQLARQQQQRQYHAEELGVYGYKPSPPSTYQGSW